MQKSPEALVRQDGRYTVFGQPVEGVKTLTVGDNGSVRFEITKSETDGLMQSIGQIIEGDKKNGANWETFGGVVIDVRHLPTSIASGLVSVQDFDNATVAADSSFVAVEVGAKKLYDLFEPEIDKLIADDHPYFKRKIIFMTPEGIKDKFKSDYEVVTVNKEGGML
jgi:hypothetical protein